jgi:hypothetical protein
LLFSGLHFRYVQVVILEGILVILIEITARRKGNWMLVLVHGWMTAKSNLKEQLHL